MLRSSRHAVDGGSAARPRAGLLRGARTAEPLGCLPRGNRRDHASARPVRSDRRAHRPISQPGAQQHRLRGPLRRHLAARWALEACIMTDAIKRERSGALQRFKPYPAYNDSGVEWLGEIPAHWEAAKLWQVGRAMSGGTPAREERTYWDGDIPWVSPKDMKRRLIDSSQDTVTERAIEETGIKLVAPPVVLIVVRGMILAHSFPVAITTVPVTINQDIKALTFRDGILPPFMAWLLEGVGKGLLTAIVDEAAHGTKAIRMDQWRSVTVPVPPDAEQRGINAFLDRETA